MILLLKNKKLIFNILLIIFLQLKIEIILICLVPQIICLFLKSYLKSEKT